MVRKEKKAKDSKVAPESVLFLCTGNSCRSQMAEGFARSLLSPQIKVYSAGISPVAVNPFVVKVMSEAGLDIRHQTSKGLSIDCVITLCGHADAYCPTLPGAMIREHWPTKDPVRAKGTEKEILEVFRRARDKIRDRIKKFSEEVTSG